MAQARIRTLCEATAGVGDINYAQIACPQLSPNVNPVFSDVWASGAIPDVTNQRYDDPTAPALTSIPASASCQAQWSARCRTIIHYETHIHPLWGTPRTDASMNDRTCTSCHTRSDMAMAPQVPAGQLDLSDGPSSDEPDHFESYRELLFQDIQQELDGTGALIDSTVDQIVQDTDANGNLLFEIETDVNGDPVIDPITGLPVLALDGSGNPIPVLVTIQVPVPAPAPAMSVNGSRSGSFMGKFLAGGSHAGDLTPAEMRLIAEWLDIGAQYFNSPFAAPEN